MPLIAAVLTKSSVLVAVAAEDGAVDDGAPDEGAAGEVAAGEAGAGVLGLGGVWANAGHAATAQTPASRRARFMKKTPNGWIGRPVAAIGSMRRLCCSS
jgi:hypothetical protein